MMVGREIEFCADRVEMALGETILSVKDLSVKGDRGETAVSGLSFEVRRREIFGIAGVSGNGQRELAEAITGLRKVEAGKIFLSGEDATGRSAAKLHEGGVSHVPEERMRFGIVPNLYLYENAVLKSHRAKRFSRSVFLDYPSIKDYAERLIARFDVSAPSIKVPPRNLSGGNIQKLILGREISAEPSFLVAAHPTYGLDVGATEYVRGQLRELKAAGGAILLLSEDLEEIFELADTVAVIFKGQFMGVVERCSADITKIGLMMAGVAQ
jgi:general nucleoside transport system ATP-binding protein